MLWYAHFYDLVSVFHINIYIYIYIYNKNNLTWLFVKNGIQFSIVSNASGKNIRLGKSL